MRSWEKAFILHSSPWRNTSLLIDLFAEETGRVRMLAKGVKAKKSSLKGILQIFTPLVVCWSGSGELKTLFSAEEITLALPLTGIYIYSGLYINELLVRMLEMETRYSRLFFDYLQSIKSLSLACCQKKSPEPALRCFELALLENLGYGVDFLHCAESGEKVKDNRRYVYCEEKGFITSLILAEKTMFTGEELHAFSNRDFSNIDKRRAAKKFTRAALKPYLGSKPIKSCELFPQY